MLDETQQLQEIGSLNVWCNTGSPAQTTYSSENNGFLINPNTLEKIQYKLDFGGALTSLATDHIDSTTAGTGKTGTTASQVLKIKPESNGLEGAGVYSDIITVTVSPS